MAVVYRLGLQDVAGTTITRTVTGNVETFSAEAMAATDS